MNFPVLLDFWTLGQKPRGLESRGMNEPQPLEMVGRNWVRLRGRELLYFSGCDYFRLARHPRVRAAARTALADHGLNVAASRLTTGNHPLYTKLEKDLA